MAVASSAAMYRRQSLRVVATVHHRLTRFDALLSQSVGKTEYRHAQAAPGCRVVCVAVVAHARYGHPLRFYITPPSVPASQSQAPFVAATASRPSGEGNRLYAKLPSRESVAQPSALPGRWHAHRAAICAPLWLSWHLGIGQALRAVLLVSGLRPVM